MTGNQRKSTQPAGIQDQIWKLLESVADPEIPVISIVDLGIVRRVEIDDGKVTVTITPTFSGCPAMHVIEREIEAAVRSHGYDVTVERAIFPPWSSDWISDNGRQKLKEFGLAPPPLHNGRPEVTFYELVPCPYCDSKNSTLKNAFGPTLCRAIYYCNNCQQPFEQFKPL